jgi:poly-gamma-glutamate capsule biosynthesis protein CapA/YwtB (metallophosphatase superfamily)
MAKRMVVTATGDSLITRRLPSYPDEAFTRMAALIQTADVAFTNLEMVLSRYAGTPVVESGGINLSADPAVARDLQRLGFNLTAFANNHTLNYGEQGTLETLRALDEMGFVCAGAGRHLAEARLPAFLEAAAGRIGLVACASTFAPGQRAGAQRADVQGRPGLNPQRFDTLYVVDQEHMGAIQRIAERTGAERQRQRRVWMGFGPPPKREGEFVFADRSFIVGPEFRIKTEAHQQDLDGNLQSVRLAREMADLVLVSIHAHEQGAERWHPADFIVEFAHACIDAGADMIIGHGPHLLRGLEIYNGKPVFYSLGNFIFQAEYLQRVPADDYETLRVDPGCSPAEVFRHVSKNDTQGFPADRQYWETVLPLCTFEGRELREIRLYPLSLGFGQPWPDRGTPRLADPAIADEVLRWMAELSAPFGTRVTIDENVGLVPVPRD